MGTVRELQEALAKVTENPATPFVIVTPTGTVCEFDHLGFIAGEGIAIHTKRRVARKAGK